MLMFKYSCLKASQKKELYPTCVTTSVYLLILKVKICSSLVPLDLTPSFYENINVTIC